MDGTKGFLRNEQYAVALALVEDGEVVLAAMGSPNLPVSRSTGAAGSRGCVFVAERGQGAVQFALDPLGSGDAPIEGTPIAVDRSPTSRPLATPSRSRPAHSSQSASALIAARLGITADPLRLDSQAKYAVVARGDASIYLRFSHGDYRENVWDHAAGSIVVDGSGWARERRRRGRRSTGERPAPRAEPRHHRGAGVHPRGGRRRRTQQVLGVRIA